MHECVAKKEMQREILPKMVKIFEELDEDGSGELSYQEFVQAPQGVQDEMHVLMEPGELEDLFDIMDEDGTGSVSHEEFFNGLILALVSNVPMEQLRIFKKLDRCLQAEDAGNAMLRQVIEEIQKLLMLSAKRM